jgi:hypothetical protein
MKHGKNDMKHTKEQPGLSKLSDPGTRLFTDPAIPYAEMSKSAIIIPYGSAIRECKEIVLSHR